MFVGAVPMPAVEQITRTVPFAEWREVFVGCSGSFRFDRSVRDVHPSVRMHSYGVSLLICVLCWAHWRPEQRSIYRSRARLPQ